MLVLWVSHSQTGLRTPIRTGSHPNRFRKGARCQSSALNLLASLSLVLLCAAPVLAAEENKAAQTYMAPRFRHVELDAKPPKIDRERLTLLADADFPPFSYADASGSPRGLAVDLALALCAKSGIQCTIKLLAWSDLPAALSRGEGDAVISGLKLDERTLPAFDATRPLYRALGRFAVRNQNPITEPSIRLLAGKRVGVAKASAHEAWLKRYFPYSQIVPRDTLREAEEALRDAKVDALFGDGLSLIYWTEGEASQGCCKLVPGAFVDQDYFSRGFVFFVRRGDTALKRVLDYGLDQMQNSGEWDRIFRAYVPANPW
jgi:polar amino acid transport system substrate-binding protein